MAMDASAEMDKGAFGKRLFTIRREQQMTSNRLAELCEVNPSFLRQIESASRLPSLPVFVRICNLLHVAPNCFLVDSLLWDEGDEIANLNQRLRALSPRQLRTVLSTTNALIDDQLEIEEPDTK
ncbi:MAG: helix-turn-helix domain-containing protein [Firmicutes bacterium]|nr:helix-turn-helix domain-containing protein [Bacillota bacterium]